MRRRGGQALRAVPASGKCLTSFEQCLTSVWSGAVPARGGCAGRTARNLNRAPAAAQHPAHDPPSDRSAGPETLVGAREGDVKRAPPSDGDAERS